MRVISVRRAFALCAATLSLAVFPAAAGAATQTEIDAAIAKAVAYASAQQEASNGEIAGFGGDWTITALAAAGVNAADLRVGPGDPSLQDFALAEYTQPSWDEDPPAATVNDYARATLVTHAAGLDPARLSASSNQPAQLAGRWNPASGSFGEASANNAAFAILAMRTAGLPAWALEPTVSFLRRNQHDDGGWTFTAALTPALRAEPSEPDMTGAAIAALCEAGVPAYDPDVASALTYLRDLVVSGSGAIEYVWGANSDVNAWVLSGLNACGVDPQSAAWTVGGKNPVDFLLTLQVPSGPDAGGFGYLDTSAASLYSTQDSLRALAGAAFTAAPPARLDPGDPVVRPAPSVAAGTPVPHLLAIELAPGNVRLCKVTAPAGATVAAVLAAAKTLTHPAGCVTSVALAGGQVESIDGVSAAGADEAWLVRLDRGASAAAGPQPVGFGDVVTLRLGANPSSDRGPQGTPGAAGPAGPKGERGKRGPRGRPGRNAELSCKTRRARAGKPKLRCVVKHHGRAAR